MTRQTRAKLKPGSKRAGVLRTLIERGQRGLTRFEAERECFDHVLPSTVSELQRDFGLSILRSLETVPGHGGKPTECARYRLADVEKAKSLLDPACRSEADERLRRAIEQERRDRAERVRQAA